MLRSAGMLADTLTDGAQVLETLRRKAANAKPFDIVVLDSRMPGVDGFEIAQALAGDARIHTPAVMLLTASGQRGDAARCREIGVRSYLTKPVSAHELVKAAVTWRTRLAVFLGLLMSFAGSLFAIHLYLSVVVVRDPDGQVAHAAFVSDHAEQALWALPGGRFAGIPDLEGLVEITCRDGRRHRWGYVTGGMGDSFRVEPGCRLRDG